mgnify:CR=1 FL=1
MILPEYIRRTIAESGLDVSAFEALGQRLANGDDLIAANRVLGRVEAPEADSWLDFSETEAEYTAWLEGGSKAIQSGALGLVILNGGMATRFGNVVKGTVDVAAGLSFLGLKIRDALRAAASVGGEPPIIILMNSKATHEDTLKHLADNAFFGYPQNRIWSFLQCWAVRFKPDGSLFLNEEGEASFYGPGHGDVVFGLKDSGLLERFLGAGGRHLLLSNVDNAVARVEPALFGLHLAQGAAVTVEVVDRFPGDQGGAPYRVDGHLQIIEGFRLAADAQLDEVPVFNTNTFWLDAAALAGPAELTWFAVPKRVDGEEVIQFERLVGELTSFTDSAFVKVARLGESSRFIPVKTPADLDMSRGAILRGQGVVETEL